MRASSILLALCISFCCSKSRSLGARESHFLSSNESLMVKPSAKVSLITPRSYSLRGCNRDEQSELEFQLRTVQGMVSQTGSILSAMSEDPILVANTEFLQSFGTLDADARTTVRLWLSRVSQIAAPSSNINVDIDCYPRVSWCNTLGRVSGYITNGDQRHIVLVC